MHGGYRFSLAALLGLVLSAITTGAFLEKHVLAANARPDYAVIALAWNLIEDNYVDRAAIRPERMTHAAIRGMVDSLGDTGHSTFLTPQMVRDDNERMRGRFPGIGAELQMRDKQVVIVAPIDGSPAQKGGLRAGDIVIRVDGTDVAGETLEQVVSRIRGPVGTSVVLSVRDPKSDHTRRLTMVRAVIHVQSVSWGFLPGTRVADLRIAEFSKGTADGLRKALAEARAGGARALVLDLRDDPGGLLDQAVAAAGEFLPGGNALLEKDAHGNLQPVAVHPAKDGTTLPLVVLVNGGTASASEILTGALQDAGRAVVVGEKTFGTGTVLNEFRLTDGSALMLAVLEWLTPKGHTIWHKGIAPNVPVALASGIVPVFPESLARLSAQQLHASKDAQLLEALSLLQSDQARAQLRLRIPG